MFAAALEEAPTFLGAPVTLWQAVNLVLFFALLVFLLRKPAKNFFADRKETVQKALRKAEEDRTRAEALAAELGKRLGEIEQEIRRLEAQAAEETAADREKLLKEADEEARRLVARTAAEIESRVRAARTELAGYAGDLAVKIARDVLEKAVTPEDQKRLLQEGVEALAKANGTAR